MLLLDGIIDNHFINHLESKLEKTNFVRVDSGSADKLIDKDESYESALSEDEQNKLKTLVEEQIKEREGQFTVVLEPMSPQDQPVIITRLVIGRKTRPLSGNVL